MKISSLFHFITTIALVGVIVLPIHPLKAQLSEKYATYKEGHYEEMRYGLFIPENYDPKMSYPLVVYLHGSRDTVSRDIIWYQDAVQKENPCFVLTPKSEEHNLGWGDTWHDRHPDASRKSLSLINELVKKYNIDTQRLYLFGISMGGFGVFSILAKEPEKFAAAYAICGGSNVNAADKLLKTPLWIFHGEKDDVVDVTLSRNIYNEIVRLGGKKVRYTEYPDVKHNSWENALREESLNHWLLLQKKGKVSQNPDRVTNLSVVSQKSGTTLTWSKPLGNNQEDKKVWYYKVFRDNDLLKEIDGSETTFLDSENKKGVTYHLVAVNFFFKESEPSASIQVN